MDESATPDAQLSYAVRSPDAAYSENLHSDAAYTDEDAYSGIPEVSTSSPNSRHLRGEVAKWLLLCRLPTLVLGLAPVLLSLALLWAHNTNISLIPALCAPLAVVFALAGGNKLDDHLELTRSAGQSWLREPGGGYYAGNVLENSGIPSLVALRVSIVVLTLSALVGIPVAVAGGVPVIVLGLLSLVCVFLYSTTRFALKRQPVGELILLLALGPGLVAATVLSQRADLTLEFLLLGFALGLFAVALVEAAHLRDLEIDARSGRHTLPVVLGKRAAYLIFAISIAAAYLFVLLAALIKGNVPGMAAVLLALPTTSIAATGVIRAQSANTRHFGVVQTLGAYIAFAAWLGVGIIVWHLVVLLTPIVISNFSG